MEVKVGPVGRRVRLVLPEPETDGSVDLSSDGGGGGPHTHIVADTTNLQADLDGKALTHSHPYAGTVHGHAVADSTGLQAALDGKAATHTHPYAGTSHSHVDGDLPAGLARDSEVSATYALIHSHPYAATSHSHVDGDLPAGLARDSEVAATYALILAHPYAATAHSHLDADLPAGIARDSEVAAAYQPLDSDLTAIAALATTSFGRALLALADGPALVATHNHGAGADVYADLGATLALAFNANDVVKSTPTATGTYTSVVPTAGKRVNVIILQSNTTAKTMTFGTGFKPTATLVLGTTASRVFVVSFVSDGTSLYEVSRTIAMVA